MPFLRRLALLAPLALVAPAARSGRALASDGDSLIADVPLMDGDAAMPAEDAGMLEQSEPAVYIDPALALINEYRAAAGAPPAALDGSLMQAAEGQVVYYDLNRGNPALNGMGLHRQEPHLPGFTGASMGDRARNAGYRGGSVTENAGFGKIETAIRWAMDTVNHRLPLIHPNAVDMGYAVSGGPGGNGFNIVDVGLRREKPKADLPSVYPAPGAVGVPRSWDGGEVPDPAPGVPRPLGYPITVAFGVTQRVEWRDLALFGPDGEALAISTPRTDWMRAAAIIPHRPFVSGQSYTARAVALVDGKEVSKEWQFTTR